MKTYDFSESVFNLFGFGKGSYKTTKEILKKNYEGASKEGVGTVKSTLDILNDEGK